MKALLIATFAVSVLILALPKQVVSYTRLKPSRETINELIAQNAVKYHVSSKTLHRVIKCESSYNPNAKGDGGHSYGLAQIHLPSNPTVTKAQALDPAFAVEFMAKKFSTGQARKWTCWRKIYLV